MKVKSLEELVERQRIKDTERHRAKVSDFMKKLNAAIEKNNAQR